MNFDLSALSMPVMFYNEFADADLLSLILHTTRQINDRQETTVSTGEQGFRSSVVSYDWAWPELYRRFCNQLEAILPRVKRDLGDYCFQCEHTRPIEVQMVSHYRTGDKFASHIDNGSLKTGGRKLSFCYYYQLTEKPMFTGGELKLHLKMGTRTIVPTHNAVVFFPSHIYHEVTPTYSETNEFEHGRHSLVGWISTNHPDVA